MLVVVSSTVLRCHQGHSIEQFRLYEALEAGAIPVVSIIPGYTRDHLPPEYFDSPMLFVNTWAEAVPEMIKLSADKAALAKRGKDMMEWYDNFMRDTVRGMEDLLESKTETEFCA